MHRKTIALIQTIFLIVLLSGCSDKLPPAGEKRPYKGDVILTEAGLERLAALAKKLKRKTGNLIRNLLFIPMEE